MHRRIPALLLSLGLFLSSCVAPAAQAPVTSGSGPSALATLAIPSSSPTQVAATATFPLTVTDDTWRTVTFDRPPQRLISLNSGHTETLYALGLRDRVIVTDKYSDYPPENKPKATLNTYPKPNYEEIVSLNPDLIVSLVESDEFFQQMDAHGIKALRLFPKTFDDAVQSIELLGRLTGTEQRAQQITTDMSRRADAVVAKTKGAPKLRVLYELDASDPTKPFVAGPGGFIGNLIPMVGGANIFDDLGKPSGQVSVEQIIARDPEIIILGDAMLPFNPQTPELVKARPGWERIAAVRSGRIYPADDNLFERPGPRLIDGLELLAKLIHPELFP